VQLSDFKGCGNLVSLFLARAGELGDKPMLWTKREGEWEATSWNEAARQVCTIAENLRRLGLAHGDRVMLVSENRPEWCLADLAIMAAGCVTVPTYTTNTARDHIHILTNSGARAAIVSNARFAKSLVPALAQTSSCEFLVSLEQIRHEQEGSFAWISWESLLAGDDDAARQAVEARVSRIGREDLACIIYTSGTGGAPRGVRQHHGMLLGNVEGCAHIIVDDFGWDDEVFLSFLPLSHAFEHTGGQFLPIGLGAQIYYAEGLEKLASNIEDVRPTVMIVVPRLFELLRARIMKQIEKQGRLANRLMDWALASGQRKAAGRRRLIDFPLAFLLERTLRPRIRERFGGRIKALVSGGAPLNPEIGIFFDALGMTMLQGYGQTEAGPVISCNRPSAGLKMDTVGPPVLGVEVKIAEDGEILARGENVTHGYWQNEGATAAAIVDGWLHTGDIGHLDEKGRIVITDRKKDMIVNDKGDNISPQKIESMLTVQPEISQAMVVGDKRPYVVALIVSDAEWALEWSRAEDEKFDIEALQDLPAFRNAIRAAIDRVNADLSVIEKVRQFTFADEPFAIENEEMTPSLKIRRHKLRERYGERLDALYKG